MEHTPKYYVTTRIGDKVLRISMYQGLLIEIVLIMVKENFLILTMRKIDVILYLKWLQDPRKKSLILRSELYLTYQKQDKPP